MTEQQDAFDRPFCQTIIPRGRLRAMYIVHVQILIDVRPSLARAIDLNGTGD